MATGVVLLLCGPVWAQAPAPEPSPEAEAATRGEPSQPDVGATPKPETAASEELPWPVYVPPSRGAPAAAVGAGTRGTREGLPAVHALAPTHPGLTMLEQPTVWWHLWERTATRVDITLSIANVEEPLLEVTLPHTPAPNVSRARAPPALY